VKLHPELHRRLAAFAEENGRSVSSQTEALIKRGFDDLSRGPAPAPVESLPDRGQKRTRARQLATSLERAFGSQTSGLLVAIGCLLQDVLARRSRIRDVQRTWISNQRAFDEATEAINTLLLLIGPRNDSAKFDLIRDVFAGSLPWEMISHAEGLVTDLAGAVALDWNTAEQHERWFRIIEDLLGDRVVDRVCRRLWAPDAAEDQNG